MEINIRQVIFMWDNIGLKKKDGTIEAYDLGSEVLNKCNIHTGLMNSFHQTRKGTKKLSEDMKELQYDMLYGKSVCMESGESI